MVDDAEAEATEPAANATPTTNKAGDAGQAAVSAPEEDVPTESLDTGVVAEAKPPVKKPVKPVKPVVEEKVNPPVKKIEANIPKLLPTTKPTNTQLVAVVKPPIKKIEATPPPKAIEKPVPATAIAPEKPAKNPELSRWTIHAGSFGQKENATTLMKTLREQGIPVSIETVQGGKGTIYRLKIGPELDKKKAAANKAKLDKQGVGNVMISE
jgi:DedD protein